jgi:hypothetical protein
VKAIVRRLRRLEDQARPIVNDRGQTPAEVIRERRRRRLEAVGLPFEDRPRESFASDLAVGLGIETLEYLIGAESGFRYRWDNETGR